MLEIDFKVELIKQLLDRIDRVHTNDVYRTALIRSMKAEERARLDKDTALEAAISKERKGLLKTLKMEESRSVHCSCSQTCSFHSLHLL